MERICLQLNQFEMKKLHVDFFSSKRKKKADINMNLSANIRLYKTSQSSRHYKLLLSTKIDPEPKVGYRIRADILGYFYVPEEIPSDIMEDIVRGNGTMILYGILRGEIAVFTGSFPEGKLTLPTIPIPPIIPKNKT